jgi:hypothetical protein
VLSGTWKVDELVPLALNNHAQLVDLYESFTAAELMAPGADGWQPVDLRRYDEVSIEEAWERHRAKRKPATVSAARRRQGELRSTAVAAETAIVSSQVERRRAPNLFNTLSSQPTPRTDRAAAAHIVRIVASNRKGESTGSNGASRQGKCGGCRGRMQKGSRKVRD